MHVEKREHPRCKGCKVASPACTRRDTIGGTRSGKSAARTLPLQRSPGSGPLLPAPSPPADDWPCRYAPRRVPTTGGPPRELPLVCGLGRAGRCGPRDACCVVGTRVCTSGPFKGGRCVRKMPGAAGRAEEILDASPPRVIWTRALGATCRGTARRRVSLGPDRESARIQVKHAVYLPIVRSGPETQRKGNHGQNTRYVGGFLNRPQHKPPLSCFPNKNSPFHVPRPTSGPTRKGPSERSDVSGARKSTSPLVSLSCPRQAPGALCRACMTRDEGATWPRECHVEYLALPVAQGVFLLRGCISEGELAREAALSLAGCSLVGAGRLAVSRGAGSQRGEWAPGGTDAWFSSRTLLSP